jgi:16S rRNA (guanine(966)-N(2))-methyltransferase RsmD
MRITGGVLRGRLVETPPGIIRPAMDRMRESVFAVLGAIGGRAFLDLFSGSGVIALEAASRGAAPVEAVEADRQKSAVMLKNVSIASAADGCAGGIRCRFMPAELFVKRTRCVFDYIFCDPPFNYRFKTELAAAIAKRGLLKEGGIMMMHRPKEENWEAGVAGLSLAESREYGRSIVDFWRPDAAIHSG